MLLFSVVEIGLAGNFRCRGGRLKVSRAVQKAMESAPTLCCCEVTLTYNSFVLNVRERVFVSLVVRLRVELEYGISSWPNNVTLSSHYCQVAGPSKYG